MDKYITDKKCYRLKYFDKKMYKKNPEKKFMDQK